MVVSHRLSDPATLLPGKIPRYILAMSHFFNIFNFFFIIILVLFFLSRMFCMLLFSFVIYVLLLLCYVFLLWCYVSFVSLSVLIVMYVPFCVFCPIVLIRALFVWKCVLYCWHWVSTQLQLNIYIQYIPYTLHTCVGVSATRQDLLGKRLAPKWELNSFSAQHINLVTPPKPKKFIIIYLSWSWITCWPVPVPRVQEPLQMSAMVPSASPGVVFHYPGSSITRHSVYANNLWAVKPFLRRKIDLSSFFDHQSEIHAEAADKMRY
jgi:hypothetical protein